MARRILCDFADTNLKLISYFHLYDFMHFSHMHNYYYGVLRQEVELTRFSSVKIWERRMVY